VAAFDHALRAVFGAGPSVAGRPGSGRLDRALAREALAEHGLDRGDDRALGRVMETMGRYYGLRVSDGDRVGWVLAGVTDVLRKLRARGIATAVASGSAAGVGRVKLVAAGLADAFPAAAWGDEVDDRAQLLRRALARAREAHGRPFLAANAVVIGDAPADVEAARAVGARVVAVATGRHSTDELDELGPDATFPDLTGTDAVVRAIQG
jgi:phosphoglycolate phosphatase